MIATSKSHFLTKPGRWRWWTIIILSPKRIKTESLEAKQTTTKVFGGEMFGLYELLKISPTVSSVSVVNCALG